MGHRPKDQCYDISQVAKIISNTLNLLEINGMSQLILTKFQVYQEEEVN